MVRSRPFRAGVVCVALLAGLVTVSVEQASADDAGGRYVSLSAFRAYDSRVTGGVLVSEEARLVQLAGTGSIPTSGVAAVMVDVTVVGATTSGFLTLYASGTAFPGTSNVNFPALQTTSNSAIVAVGTDGRILAKNRSPGTAHVIIDVQGYFTASHFGGEPAGYRPVTSRRIVDTRAGLGGRSTPLGPLETWTFTASGADIPSDVQILALNITIVAPTSNTNLTVWPYLEPMPSAPLVDAPAAVSTAHFGTVRRNSQQISLRNYAGQADVIVDVSGYFAATGATPGGYLVPASGRLIDTRTTNTAIAPSGFLTVPTSAIPIAADASGVAVNVTAVAGAGAGYLRVWPAGGTEPPISHLNFTAASIKSNLVLTSLGASQSITIRNLSGAPIHVLVDLQGWFTAVAPLPGVPNSVTASARNHNIQLAWTAPTSGGAADGYRVQARQQSTGSLVFEEACTECLDTLVTGLTPGVVYNFEVRAHGASGYGAAASLTRTSQAQDTPLPSLAVTTPDPSELVDLPPIGTVTHPTLSSAQHAAALSLISADTVLQALLARGSTPPAPTP